MFFFLVDNKYEDFIVDFRNIVLYEEVLFFYELSFIRK